MESVGYQLIVVGASAGGLDVISEVLGNLPQGFSTPIAIVQHMGKASHNKLSAVLSARCGLDISEIEDKEPIQRSKVYIAPPNYHVLAETEGYFSLSVDEEVSFARPSIDVLFSTAADAFRSRTIGVLLSGANHDGADGLAQIQECGGYTLIQHPDTAQFDRMPRMALERMTPSFMGSPQGIAHRLVEITQGDTLHVG